MKYYDNTAWSGTATWNEIEDGIDHDWGAAAPGGGNYGVNADNFSAVWEGNFEFDTETYYTFSLDTDDSAATLYVDGVQVTPASATMITAGTHSIKLQYSHAGGDAYVKLAWHRSEGFIADAELKVWEGDYTFTTDGDYDFLLASDDLSPRLYIDGDEISLTIGTYGSAFAEQYYAKPSITKGTHTVRVEYSSGSSDIGAWALWFSSNVTPSGAFTPLNADRILISGQITDGLSFSDATGHVDHFENTVTWAGEFNFESEGYYEFVGRFSGNVAISVDGTKYLSAESNIGPKAYHFSTYLSSGYHDVQVIWDLGAENYDYPMAVAELDWYARADDMFRGYYYESEEDMAEDDVTDEDNYAGVAPRLIASGSSIDFSLANGGYLTDAAGNTLSGDGTQITDDFAVRQLGNIGIDSTEEGVYVFTVAADDNVRLWLDNAWLLDQWDGVERGVTTYQEAAMLHEDSHAVRLEYADNSTGDADGGKAELSWTKIDAGVFNAQYFSSGDLSGTPTDGGTVTSIDYTGTGSARWVGVFEFTESDYSFSVNTDGGVRLYLDGDLLIDQWTSSTGYSATVAVEEGLHSLKVEYSGGSTIDVNWTGVSEIAGNALSFDGVDDYVALPAVLDPATDGAFTVELWVNIQYKPE